MDTAIMELIKMFKELSPQLWAVLLKQVQVEAIQNFIAFIVATVLTIISIYYAKIFYYKHQENKYDSNDMYCFCTVIVTIICGITAFVCLNTAIGYMVNPEFYAIRFILSQIGQ